MDKIYIENLEVFAHHGVYKEEKILGQKFVLDIVLYAELREAGKTDDLSKTINYGEVCHNIVDNIDNCKYDLIEKVVEDLVEKLLLSIPQLEAVKVKLKKPWAPIAVHLDNVAVEIKRKWHRVYLGVGSNMGNKKENIQRALKAIENPKTKIVNVSSYYETNPVGEIKQDMYLNGVIEIKTLLTPEELMLVLLDIEDKLGRKRTVHWGPRIIDLDILLFDDMVTDTEKVTLPHVEMHKRLFVLVPLCEINPRIVHPIFRKRILEIKCELEESQKI